MLRPVARLSMLGLTVCGMLLSLRAQTPPSESALPKADATELLANPTLADGARGWKLREAKPLTDGGPDGMPAVELAGVEPNSGKWSHVGLALEPPPRERALRFTCRVRPDGAGQSININVFTIDAQSTTLQSWRNRIALDSAEWTQVSVECVADSETSQLTLWVVHDGARAVRVADAHFIAGEPERAPIQALTGPGVLRASAAALAAPGAGGATGTVTFPIPSTHGGQVPLAFDLQCDPPSALRGFKWVRRDDGLNWSCEVEVTAPEDGVIVRWEALVLVPGMERRTLPKAEAPEVPSAARPWLRSTTCVQSDDAGIAAKAAELAEGTSDIEAYVQRVVEFTSTNPGIEHRDFLTLDAREGLAAGGSCTCRANLAAALLRARGIPARTQSHLPTWTAQLYEHWLVEYWHPGAGWVWIEPSQGELQPAPFTLVVLAIAGADDEDHSFDECIGHSNVMLGAPHRTVHEISAGMSATIELTQKVLDSPLARVGNWAKAALRLNDVSPSELAALTEAAEKAFESLAARSVQGRLDPERTRRIEAAIAARDASALRAALAP
jgi:hypothetical protein